MRFNLRGGKRIEADGIVSILKNHNNLRHPRSLFNRTVVKKMEEIMVQVLGCGDAFGSGGRFHSCFLVKASSLNLLIDCGGTAVVGMKKNNISTNEIDIIIISHFHGDHFGGLPYFFLDACFLAERTKPLTIITPSGGYKRIKDLTDLLYPGSPEIMNTLSLNFIEYDIHKEIKIENFSLKAYPAIHTPDSLPHSLRMTIDNKTIGFSGDTEWSDNLLEVARGADLFICESTFYNHHGKGHISYHEVLRKKDAIDAKRILLTHMGEEVLRNINKALSEFEYAEDGKILFI